MAPAGILRPIAKWGTIYKVFFQDALVYKANAVIWLMTDTVPAIIMPLVWLSSYNGRAQIGGFSPSQMVVYYMVVLFLSCIVESHILWDMNADLKQGRFNSLLVRPYSVMAYYYANNLTWRLMRTLMFVPLFTGVLALFHHWVVWQPKLYDFGWRFWLAAILGHLVSFSLAYTMGLLSLWLTEARSVYNFYYLPLIVFNGQLAPLSFFPHKIAEFAYVLPFAYTLGFPTQVFLGKVQGAALWHGYGMQVLWIGASLVLSAILWRGGVKRYTAFGI